jgi:hypothetical protein
MAASFPWSFWDPQPLFARTEIPKSDFHLELDELEQVLLEECDRGAVKTADRRGRRR